MSTALALAPADLVTAGAAECDEHAPITPAAAPTAESTKNPRRSITVKA
jgi:hypothetical protein